MMKDQNEIYNDVVEWFKKNRDMDEKKKYYKTLSAFESQMLFLALSSKENFDNDEMKKLNILISLFSMQALKLETLFNGGILGILRIIDISQTKNPEEVLEAISKFILNYLNEYMQDIINLHGELHYLSLDSLNKVEFV